MKDQGSLMISQHASPRGISKRKLRTLMSLSDDHIHNGSVIENID